MLNIITQQHNHYKVTKEGFIIRSDMKVFQPSGQWLFKGLRHVKKNEFIPFANIDVGMLDDLNLLYKNRKPQYLVIDNDHGTTRGWGDRVKHLYFDKD